jgi:hypothetical protein
LAEASYQAVTTLAFVSPSRVLHRALEQLRIDINPAVINAITETEIAIWATPEGTAFVDGNCASCFIRIDLLMLECSVVLQEERAPTEEREGLRNLKMGRRCSQVSGEQETYQ